MRFPAAAPAGIFSAMDGFAITAPLPERFREDAAALYLSAFEGKLGPLLGRGGRARAFLADCIRPANGIAALSRDGTVLLGVAGIQDRRGGFIGGGMPELIRHYGALGGPVRGFALTALEREARAGALQMDGLCVAEAARGQGVGGALLHAVAAEARARGLRQVRLDVIDANKRAAALYRRHGYEDVGRTELGPLRHLFGFRAATTMALSV
ncbi:GNAT family N-acetyltransferase [Rhodovulum sp. DZ06]|uniref:GNAT family N-acetyltransferase n=1 Tax=Rhodovulum sp. DZ06 TaxID=3425126 RepID=UPI003D34C945